jgi:hypothetical protein
MADRIIGMEERVATMLATGAMIIVSGTDKLWISLCEWYTHPVNLLWRQNIFAARKQSSAEVNNICMMSDLFRIVSWRDSQHP